MVEKTFNPIGDLQMRFIILTMLMVLAAPAQATGNLFSPHHNNTASAKASAKAKSSSKSSVKNSGNSYSKSGVYGSGNSHQGQLQGQSYTDNSSTVYEARKPAANVASSYASSSDQTGASISGRSGGLGFTWTARWAKTMKRSEYLAKMYGPMAAMAHDCNYAQFRRNIRDAHSAGYLEVDCSVFDKNPPADLPIK